MNTTRLRRAVMPLSILCVPLISLLPSSTEMISFAQDARVLAAEPTDADRAAGTLDVRINETLALSFVGPLTNETAEQNPFTDYRLLVTFTQGDESITVRGFYAADGDAAETGATEGNVWRCRFSANRPGTWSYQAKLTRGDWIAINDDPAAGEPVELQKASGQFNVTAWPSSGRTGSGDKQPRDFRQMARLTTDGHYYRFGNDGPHWIKAGTNSPENLLAYNDFDDTYRMAVNERSGEAKATEVLHDYAPHAKDWRDGDPTWQSGKGKSLVGALNYLASTGMNSVYFLSMNITGDGKDVWPYAGPQDFTRFDCSKLDQWEIVFEHMQRLGLMLHVVTQETENERLLDDGDTGKHRKLYYSELISRFAHHPAIVWNLGEENGPANFSPNGQTTAQEKSMADYIAGHDPYGNTVVIHTHSTEHGQDEILEPLLGHESLDGVSLQVNEPKRVHHDVKKWIERSAKANHPWAVTMDEIGPADHGGPPDSVDPRQDAMRGPVLWGSLMAGAGGVEWYFGYKLPDNDLNAEDWRSRSELWRQTHLAVSFFEEHLPYWKMMSADELLTGGSGYCSAAPGSLYVVYRSADQASASLEIDLTAASGDFRVQWYSPRLGGELLTGSTTSVKAGSQAKLGMPPDEPEADWVALVTRVEDSGE